ncbi:putative glyoxylate reductase [Bacteriovorax sp. BSW11_IV]|uniref:2-hydroxyacid dehydrogenase n=1 Tax=Bacteriovorax sp. BSW11_IV TaxID=1353529 RepID=UPI00038A501A|nr:D-glycerate dehydrogenase [Bacteriovorax sp. BSW11_IV]EQC43655.1 putative glyoxylate reductase [Bacteriovorax sp. BSW11_IV]
MTQSVLITRRIPELAMKKLKEQGINVIENSEDRPLSSRELHDLAQRSTGLITMLSDKIDKDFLAANSHLKVISNFAVGHNNIDSAFAKTLGIQVGNTPDVLTHATAELAMTLLLACARNLQSATQNVKSGQWNNWEPMGFLGMELYGKCAAIIGAGRIGQRMGEILNKGFGMNILYTAQSDKKDFEKSTQARRVELNEALQMADIVSVHCPLTENTRNLFNQKNFALMKKGSIFINTARGEIHDEKALHHFLTNGTLFAAGLDVTNPEPMSMNSELLKLPNCLVLPHIGSATVTARQEMALICARNIIQGLNGEKLECSVV